jgi:hypothetical protein
MPFPARTRSSVPTVFVAALLGLCTIFSPVLAQTGVGANKEEASHERVIITSMPAEKSHVHDVLAGSQAKSEALSLETMGSEVWLVPKAEFLRLEKTLEGLGHKLIRIEENWRHVLTRHKEPVSLTLAQQAVIDKVTKSPETINVGVHRMPHPALVEHALTHAEGKITLPLGEKDIAVVRTRPVIKTEGGYTWRGEVEETGEKAVLMLWRDAHLSGYLGYNGSVFMINYMGGDIHTVAEMDPRRLPPEHAPSPQDKTTPRSVTPEPTVSPFPEAERLALEAKKITIDVMLIYTKNVASHYIGTPADRLALAIEEANETFRNSGIGNIDLRLIHSQPIDFDETGVDHFNIVYGMEDGTGPFTSLKKLRNEKRADLVGLIVDDAQGCGLSTRVSAGSEEAFFVVHHSCAAITISIAHEIGHILGARHDRMADDNEQPFAYAHGYVNGTKWRTMMSYNKGCGGCPRIPYWSNPRIMYKGEPTGTPATDNARVILQQAERVSQFR